MSKQDPTEDVLATIARIFEHADAMKAAPRLEAKPDGAPIVNPFAKERSRSVPMETSSPQPIEPVQEAPEVAAETVPPDESPTAEEPERMEAEAPPPSTEPDNAPPTPDGYTRLGPGPLEAIRFRWSARADGEGRYFVDERIGPTSRAITSGPMSGEDAIAFIELQVQEAFERFERLKQSAAELPTHREAKAVVEQVHAEHDASEDQGF